MDGPYRAVKVSDHVYWVGAIDWGIRDFHGYTTIRGSTYNAYLIAADDFILVDTVRAPFKDELLSRIASVTDPGNIRYLISNHAEPDHTGSLPSVIEAVRPEKVFASPMGTKALPSHYHKLGQIEEVKDGESMSLGGVNLSFMETRMVHWPDSMMTYLADDRLLFSQDGFGMHLATSARFADEIDPCMMDEENAKYFANILLPYAPIIAKLLDRVAASGLQFDIVAPDHGPIWREPSGIKKSIETYVRWCAQAPREKAVVVFDTMWGSTEKMGRAIGEALTDEGIEVVVMSLKSNGRSEVMTQILDAGAVVVGTPTLNNNVFPSLADTLTYMRGLKPKNLVGAAFGSYGWSGEGAKLLAEMLAGMKVELVGEPLNVNYVPDDEALESCRALGRAVAGRLKEVVRGGS